MTTTCPGCGAVHAYDTGSCLLCGASYEMRPLAGGTVLAITRVDAPSIDHEEVPYWTALIETDSGEAIIKLDSPAEVGEKLSFESGEDQSRAIVGVAGTGVMACGLAELLLKRGHRVVMWGRSITSVDKARAKVLDRLSRTMDVDELDLAATLFVSTTELDAFGECDVVIEAVAEEMQVKHAVLPLIESAMRNDAVFATNTSGLSLEDMSTALKRPEQFGALHFFNPPIRMKLVETAVCSKTSPKTSSYLDTFATSLGRVPIRVSATPAFAVNRALMPLLNEAVRELEDGVASAEDIDAAVRLGLNHPMGPLALCDLIGLDVVVDIMDNLVKRTGDASYGARPLLKTMVEEGRLGRKTGEGFYSYAGR